MSGAFYIEMTFRTVLAVGGDDRKAFLQDLVTNDIALVAPGKPLYACLLTPQGKFLHDFIIMDDTANGRFLLLCEKERRMDLMRRLNIYKLRSKVTIEDLTETRHLFFIWGDANEGIVDPRKEGLGRWLITEQATPEIKAQKADWVDYNHHRILLGVPEGSLDMEPERATLLDNNIDELHGISWTKGCYTGQEVTARMNYRGLVRRRLVIVRGALDLPPSGTPVQAAGSPVGELKSVQGNIGLALLRLDNGQQPEVGGEVLIIQK